MSLSRPKFEAIESLEEAQHYNAISLPKMGATTMRFAPLLLEVPLFSVARGQEGRIEATWSRPGRGSVKYRGPALTQSHQTLLFTLLHVRAGQPVSNIIEFHATELLGAMGWSKNARNTERLARMIDDLFEARLDVWGPTEPENAALSVRFFADKRTPHAGVQWSVNISERVLHLFQGHLSHINLRKRAELREGLATFVYGYTCANNGKVPVGVAELHKASGSDTRLGAFTGKLREALETLKEHGCIAGYKLEDGKLRVLH